jgi:hypothetical protein
MAASVRILPQHQALHAAAQAIAAVETDSQRRCERALDMLLTQRGDASAEVDRLLADDPGCVFGHCLRSALIVRAESAGSRSALGASIAAIEAARPDASDPARRHAVAARAWLDGNPAYAIALYGVILTVWPQDVLALAVAHALDFHLGRRRVMRDRIAKVLVHCTAEMPGCERPGDVRLCPRGEWTVSPRRKNRAACAGTRSRSSRRHSRRRACDGNAGPRP